MEVIIVILFVFLVYSVWKRVKDIKLSRPARQGGRSSNWCFESKKLKEKKMNEAVSCKNIVALLVDLTKENRLQWKDGFTVEFPDSSRVNYSRRKMANGEIEYSIGTDVIIWDLDEEEEEKVLAKELFDLICDHELKSLQDNLTKMRR